MSRVQRGKAARIAQLSDNIRKYIRTRGLGDTESLRLFEYDVAPSTSFLWKNYRKSDVEWDALDYDLAMAYIFTPRALVGYMRRRRKGDNKFGFEGVMNTWFSQPSYLGRVLYTLYNKPPPVTMHSTGEIATLKDYNDPINDEDRCDFEYIYRRHNLGYHFLQTRKGEFLEELFKHIKQNVLTMRVNVEKDEDKRDSRFEAALYDHEDFEWGACACHTHYLRYKKLIFDENSSAGFPISYVYAFDDKDCLHIFRRMAYDLDVGGLYHVPFTLIPTVPIADQLMDVLRGPLIWKEIATVDLRKPAPCWKTLDCMSAYTYEVPSISDSQVQVHAGVQPMLGSFSFLHH